MTDVKAPDILSTNHGTIITIMARTRRGSSWIRRHVPDAIRGRADCDHRCGIDILEAALAHGLTLQDTRTGRLAGPETITPHQETGS
jgi:hypothetical protein